MALKQNYTIQQNEKVKTMFSAFWLAEGAQVWLKRTSISFTNGRSYYHPFQCMPDRNEEEKDAKRTGEAD